MKICLDPGHGQYGNKGVLGYYEGTQMWHLGQYMQAEFEKRGWVVKNTRPRITDDPSLRARGEMAQGCDLFISLHSNAPGTSAKNYSSIRGVSIYDSVADELDYLEKPLAAEISRIMNTPDLGVKHWESAVTAGNDYFGVLRNAVRVGCPDAFLIEHGYHTNEQAARWLLSQDNLMKLAAAEADLIDRLWRAKFNPKPTPAKDAIYRVQTGAFRVRSNADAFEAEIKKKGFDTYLVQADGFFKVQVGAYSVKANADAMSAKLRSAGYDNFITTQSGTPAPATQKPSIATIKLGSKVKVKPGAKTYEGQKLASFVYDNVYDVQQLSGSRAVIGQRGVVTAAMRVVDLIPQ
jgi:N-acetylmuramoyl-L-alanine amidase